MAQSKGIPRSIAVGTAGWSIPRSSADSFGVDGSHLERYARVMPCVEINSSFYRPHRALTYARWRDRTPDTFRFSVKVPKAITHEAKLACDPAMLDAFVAQVAGLGAKLAVLLVQLAPSYAFVPEVADAFFAMLRARYPGGIACEPRHASWFEADANDLLIAHRVTR
ncbi:MAG: DUF72 domain-containing protein, partial [Proteobacteria bacterium]|nr:DUF72 domain-containing protein [Burkholderiales bacterium]